MGIEVAGGRQQDGIVIGNAFDKYNSRNPIVRHMMAGFDTALSSMLARARPGSIHEIGCGEGYWVLDWQRRGYAARGSDFSSEVIDLARANARAAGMAPDAFSARSIYQLDAGTDGADLLVCCEVLEHLDDPRAGLAALQRVVTGHLIVSVPREPLWRALNLARGKYVGAWGNTPGHLQHWSRRRFVGLVGQYFEIVARASPLPWTMLLCRPLRGA